MVLRFGQSRAEDVATLIARRNYSKAIEVIRAQLKAQKADARLRLQLGDVLALAGRDKEAVQVLAPLADEFAREGFAAKAVAILKKIQKLDPGRRDVDARLAELIEQKQRHATVLLPLVPPPSSRETLEIGMEEIGFEPPARAVPESEPPAPEPDMHMGDLAPALEHAAAEPPETAFAATGAELDLGLASEPLVLDGGDALPARDSAPLAPPPPARSAAAPAHPPGGAHSAAVVLDQDLFTEDPDLLVVEPDAEPEFVDVDTGAAAATPDPAITGTDEPDGMSDNAFADELLSLVEGAFAGLPGGDDGVPMPDHDIGPPDGGTQIVISPLFKDFSVDEMVAVIQGLKLLTFEPRQIVLREGQPGDAMYMLTAGTAKAYVRNAEGKQVLVGELNEGAFFGEVAVLTGRPRTATVVAATHCELLELDRATLDGITARHPHVRDVLEEFARERLARRG